MVPSDRTVTTGVGHGKQAARHINAWLRDETYELPPRNDLITADMLRPWFATEARRQDQRTIRQDRRRSGFEEVKLGLDEKEAVYEARRCLSCGNCFECDGCYGACPEGAVIKLGPGRRYRFDFDLCTGCAVCFEQCPCHAIRMTPEPALSAATDATGDRP